MSESPAKGAREFLEGYMPETRDRTELEYTPLNVPMICELLEAYHLHASGEQAAPLSDLAAIVGQALVELSLAPGESLTSPSDHAIVFGCQQMRARAEKAEGELKQARHLVQRGLEITANPSMSLRVIKLWRNDAQKAIQG